MREILFRGKRIDNGEWAEGSLILAEDFCCILEAEDKVHPMDYPYFDGDIGIIDGNVTPVDPATVGQYTGLTDKHGRRIFEGDIVKCKHFYDNFDETFDSCKIRRAYGKAVDESNGECTYWRNYEVRMGDGRWVLRNGSDGHDMKQNYVQNHLVEVIGNIHDNPELLNGGVENGRF